MLDSSLLNLPWATLVTLASGYVGYFIANVGLKEHHKTVDITFSTLVFGLISATAYESVAVYAVYWSTLVALVTAIITGAVWRKYGRRWMYKLMRALNISWSDGTHSAWQQLFGQIEYRATEVFVILKDGSGLLSRPLARFEGLPNGPFALGNTGDVILYVTHHSAPDSDEWREFAGVIDDSWGALATYIPAEQIARVEIRRNKIKTASTPPKV
ncbi:hypothetical protein [Arsenophonus sp. PmNCSU2021_1]|uniref:hypothetical protein n=2 Tax=Arsenophonus sp. PmNCSU2021_1 TaxID=3118989 RepID=UPI002FF38E6B